MYCNSIDVLHASVCVAQTWKNVQDVSWILSFLISNVSENAWEPYAIFYFAQIQHCLKIVVQKSRSKFNPY